MALTNNPNLTPRARELRKNMTKEERRLWYNFLCTLPCQVHRQFVIGRYIVDFYCPLAKLIIEADGAQHYEEEATVYDKERDEYLRSLGYTILRYTNIDIQKNFKGICEDILNHLPI